MTMESYTFMQTTHFYINFVCEIINHNELYYFFEFTYPISAPPCTREHTAPGILFAFNTDSKILKWEKRKWCWHGFKPTGQL